ncbi:MAG TPA: carboxypeptidase-like regulatory domain-containing protein, partial [Flavisolibacter sp.]
MRRQLDCLLNGKALHLALLLFLLPYLALAQPGLRLIRGTVKDDKGAGLPGITVTVKGTSRANATDVNGAFTINAAEGETLVFSAVSYSPVEVKVTNENNYN